MFREKANNPIARALWYIESHLDEPLTLDAVAEASSVSKFHLARVFGHAIGCSVLRYVRNRRLSRAAAQLAAGAPDILTVALEAGYGSHEAFTRAFRERIGVTPETVRAAGQIDTRVLQEPLRMPSTQTRTITPVRIENRPSMRLVGLSKFVGYGDTAAIPSQWQAFHPYIGNIAGQTGTTAYGVCTAAAPDSEGFIYAAAVEVSASDEAPQALVRIDIAPHRYAVFHHKDHVSTIQTTTNAIFGQWLAESSEEIADSGATLIEVYDQRFDPRTGRGGFEIWVPLKG